MFLKAVETGRSHVSAGICGPTSGNSRSKKPHKTPLRFFLLILMEEGKAGARELEKTKGSSSQLIQHLEAVEAKVALKAVGRDVNTCVEYQAVEIRNLTCGRKLLSEITESPLAGSLLLVANSTCLAEGAALGTGRCISAVRR